MGARRLGGSCWAALAALLVVGCNGGGTCDDSACGEACREAGCGGGLCGGGGCDCIECPGADGDTDSDVDSDGDADGDVDRAGDCVPGCYGQSCCDRRCVDLATDPSNCGVCGRVCGGGEACVGGACAACTPACEGAECGPDGCGGRCGTCEDGQVCVDGSCQGCEDGVNCDLHECGTTPCGRSCGTCAAGTACTDTSGVSTCQPCTPDCAGAACGDSDGCGGRCDGSCPGGGLCESGLCAGGCRPDCDGRGCGNDGCGGSCGECEAPETCEHGLCVCTPRCVLDGLECGRDGCFGSCGECDGDAPVCGALGQCAGDPLTVGCSDGTREGFTNVELFPDLAGCQATWIAQSLRATGTGVPCGNDYWRCDAPEDACAAGWHICMKQGWPSDVTDRVSWEDCGGVQAGVGPWVFAASYNSAASPRACDTNGVVCCGTSDRCWVAGYGWGDAVWTDRTYVTDGECSNAAPRTDGTGGILCCRNPERTGS